jgi:hypothetical protein
MNNEPVAWMQLHDKDGTPTKFSTVKTWEDDIPLYTHLAKTKELLDEIKVLKEKLMMEEESYILLDEELLFAKESIKHQKAEIEALKAKTLTDEEIYEVWRKAMQEEAKIEYSIYATQLERQPFLYFARAILKKAQEK